MANVTFEKLSDHTAVINQKTTIVWRIRITGSIDEYYIRADKIHAKVGGGYWADSKHLIPLSKVSVPEPFVQRHEIPTPGIYLSVTCGQCSNVNSINQDTLHQNQGAHYCKSCNGTIALVIQNNIRLKNGSKAGNLTQ